MAPPLDTNLGTAEWQALDSRHHLHPFTDYRELLSEGSRIITRADGCYIWDSEGNRLLDGMAGLWNVNVGYGRKEIADAAYKQLLELPYYNTFFKTATPPSVELSARLVELAPGALNHVFFANSGSEANDTIVRMVRHYYNLIGKPEKKTFISRREAYHGSTMASASLGGQPEMHAQADLPLPGFVHVREPHPYRDGAGQDPEAFGLEAAREIERKILELGPETVAAFIGEPVMGDGVLVPPASYWPEVARICREYDVLLVIDEVVCGFGRLGHWFGCQAYGVEPDLVPIAKGLTSGYLPLSGILVADKVVDVLVGRGGTFKHGFTYSGHPVSCAVALANIDIIEREGLVRRVAEDTGPYLQSRLARLADHPLVGDVRGTGLMAGIEMVADKDTRASLTPEGRAGALCREHAQALGLVTRSQKDIMLFSPPLIISRKEIDRLVDLMAQALDATARDLGR